MPIPLAQNPYFMANYRETIADIKDRHGGKFPKISSKDNDKILDTVKKLYMAEDAMRRYGFRKAEVKALTKKLEGLGKKYDVTVEELRLMSRFALNCA